MDAALEKALDTVLRNWASMSGANGEEAESTANDFEASFYRFIDTVREWVNELEKRPRTLEELLALPAIEEIIERLPAPLLLNFETEAEYIVEQVTRIDDEKYD